MKINQKWPLIYGLILFFSACAPIHNSQYEKYSKLVAEAPECLTNYTYTNSKIVSGSAKFYKRGINLVLESNQLKGMTLGDPLIDALPIRYAEVAVYNSSNQLVQCGLTDGLGNLKATNSLSDLLIPALADQYIIHILARSNIRLAAPAGSPSKAEFTFHVAVKKDIYTNEVHSISKTFSTNGVDDTNNLNLLAYARQTDSLEVEGGAFNIFNSLYTAYDYVRNNTGTVDVTCLSDKLNVYWKLGFNPFQYSNPSEDPSYINNGSYYNADEKNLYITGGRLGEITMEVTNHFDDFIIIHEFGHHIENQCGHLSTPGGTHVIISRIDPRLAWSEGWSNYFAGQVMYSSINTVNPEISTKLTAAGLSANWTYLFGSKGFSDSFQNIGNGTGFMFDMKKPGNNPDVWQSGAYQSSAFDKIDATRYPGEGHFREGAISRGLFKLANNCGGSCISTTPVTFENIWKSMDKLSGAGQTIYAFKSSHTVLEILKNIIGSVAWGVNYKSFNESITSEALHLFSDGAFTSGGINRWVSYGRNLSAVTAGSCAEQYYIEPRIDDPVLTASNSDQRYSNHFYTIDLNTLSNVDEISVNLEKKNMSGSSVEFDLILYSQNYFFEDDYVCSTSDSVGNCTAYSPTRLTTSDMARADRRSGSVATKTIRNLQALDHTKKFLLNVRAYTANKTSISTLTDYSYTFTNQSGQFICP